jgi:FMN-dependent NADH-azoreductase
MKTLFINSCIREDDSRTYKLALAFIEKLNERHPKAIIDEIRLMDLDLKPYLYSDIKRRDELISKNEFNDPMFKYANQFKDYDFVIIATPFWDLSFPSILKVYIEKLCVNNLTFKYENNREHGLCKLSKFMLIATSGGERIDNKLNYLFDIIDFLSSKKVKKYYSYLNGLDMMDENNIKGVTKKAINDFDKIICEI